MTRRMLNVLFALALTAGVVAGSVVFASAQEPEEDGSNMVVFPWVPNGSMIDDPRGFGENGPFYGTVTVQNLEDEEITLYYAATDESLDYDDLTEWESESLDAHESTTLSAAEIGVATPGGGAVVQGVIENGADEPARISAVQKQAAGEPAPTTAQTTSDHNTVAGYSGLYAEDIGTTAILPIAQINNNWNTIIHITNFDDETVTDVTVQFRPADGTGWSSTFTFDGDDALGPGETGTIDLLASNAPVGWTGSATIEASTDVAAVAERSKNEDDMLIINVSQNPDIHGGTQSAPLIFRDWFGWNTGISIANLSNATNEVKITYYDPDGDPQGTETLQIPANGMSFSYRVGSVPDNANGGFVGSAVITSAAPIVGSVDEVKYFGREDDEDVGHAMSYMVELNAAEAGESLSMPLVQRGDETDSDGDTTGIQIANPTGESVTVALWYLEDDGTPFSGSLEIIELAGNESHTSYTLDVEDLPAGFQGSAIIQVLGGEGAVTAVANVVNYSVINDGSSTYNLFRTSMAGPEVEGDAVPAISLVADPTDENEDETFQLSAQLEGADGNSWFLSGVAIEFELDATAAANAGLHEVGDPTDSGATITVTTDSEGVAQVEATRDALEEEDDWLPLTGTVTATIADTDVRNDVQITWSAPVEENGNGDNGDDNGRGNGAPD